MGTLPCTSLDGLCIRRLVNIDAALHPFELILEDYLNVSNAVIEEVDHVIVCPESSNVPLKGLFELVHVY